MKKILCAALYLLLCCALGVGALALEDGVYAPDSVSVSGGTGRVAISCGEVRVEDGQAFAVVVFGSPYYTQAVLDGQVYPAVQEGETSVFTLPVMPGQAVTFGATTTAMSTPHEIAYTLYVSLGEEDTLAGLAHEGTMMLAYAEGFSVETYAGGYALIDVKDDTRYLVVPEGMEPPEGLDPAIVVLRQPIGKIYLAASSVMAFFDALDAVDAIRLSGTRAENWTSASAVQAMERGEMLFAGKYSEPDFELLLREQCGLAIESTMILHAPKVKEMLELLGIPVLVDRSSYETHPLGRAEWIRLYGVLMGREAQAQAAFDRQAQMVEALADLPDTEKTVAFFYLHSNGTVVVRGEEDCIAQMIALAGGHYAFDGLAAGTGSVQLTMEEFYRAAVNADVLIYNATIEEPIRSTEELLAKDTLFADFTAVQEGRVYCTGSELYQAADAVGAITQELHGVLTDETQGLAYFAHLE